MIKWNGITLDITIPVPFWLGKLLFRPNPEVLTGYASESWFSAGGIFELRVEQEIEGMAQAHLDPPKAQDGLGDGNARSR
jgi:hypothetical protein